MNKWQLICPVAAVVLVLLLASPIYVRRVRMQRRDAITWGAICAGRDLQLQTNSTLLVSMPPRLEQALKEFLTTPSAYLDTIRFGDEPPPIGDGTATHRVYIRNFKEDSIALRLRYEPKLKKFHVLGFWQANSWPE